MTDLVFLDTETTGLDPSKHEVWEIAVAINDGPITSHILVHSLKTADPKALDLNGYFRNHPRGARSEGPMVDLELREVLKENTLVCSNPTFDRMFLFMRWGYEPWHHRSIAIETMALTVFNWERPRGLADITQELIDRNYDIPQPDHSAYSDVLALRECYRALRQIQSEKQDG